MSYMSCGPLGMFYCFFVVDCAGDLIALKEKSFSLQEGVKYRLKIHFKVSWKDTVTQDILRMASLSVGYCVCVCVRGMETNRWEGIYWK